MIEPVDNKWRSNSLLRVIGYCLLILALFDTIDILVPPHFMDPAWEIQTIGQLVERVPVPLLGLGLVFYPKSDFRSKWEGLPNKFLSWASLLAGVLFLLLVPLLVVDNSRIDDQINYQINTQVTQQLSGLEQVEKQLNKATTAQDIDGVIARLNLKGLPPNIKNQRQLKSRILSEITKAKKTIRSQALAAGADRRSALLRSSFKWLLEALVSGATFIYIWGITCWVRRGSRRPQRVIIDS